MSLFDAIFMGDKYYGLNPGAEAQINTAIQPKDSWVTAVSAITTTKLVSLFSNAAGTNAYGVVSDISGSTITPGATQLIGAITVGDTYNVSSAAIDSTTVFAVFEGTANQLKEITEAAGVLTLTASTTFGATITRPGIANLDSTYSVVVYRESGADVNASIISNAGLVVNAPVTLAASCVNANQVVALDSTYFLTAYTDGSNDLYVICGARSGTTISAGTPEIVISNPNAVYITRHSATSAAIYYKYNAAPYDIYCKIATISGTTVTLGSEMLIKTVGSSLSILPYRLMATNFTGGTDAVVYTDVDDANAMKGTVATDGAAYNTFELNSNDPTKPCAITQIDTSTFFVQYYETNAGAGGDLYGKVVTYP